MAIAVSLTSFRCARCRLASLESLKRLTIRKAASLARWNQPCGGSLRRSIYRAARLSPKDVSISREPKRSVHDQASSESSHKLTEGNASEQNHNGDSTPWYLRGEEHQDDESPLAHRQRLPDVPQNSPPILEPLLQHLSVDIGLDYLNLLDLRNVEPPPAFGANLFMIFGTARSERHLNVSADRLCRWLRSAYKLTPCADGLLGRNELKLKLKRKARRARVLGAVGASAIGPVDDGTTTGWVCVNVGEVGNGSDEEKETQILPDGLIGFGKKSNTSKIIVQMMTEEKRGDLDLETLWQGVLKSSAKRREHSDDLENTPPLPSRAQYDNETRRQLFLRSIAQRDGERREFHTVSACRMASLVHTNLSEPTPDTALHNEPNYEDASKEWGTIFAHLAELPDDAARQALGEGEDDTESTQLLKDINARPPFFRESADWQALLWIHSFALDLGHERYSKLRLWQLFVAMDESGVFISSDIAKTVLRAIVSSPHALQSQVCEAIFDISGSPQDQHLPHLKHYSNGFKPVEHTMYLVFDILERTLARGIAGGLVENLMALHESISFPKYTPDHNGFEISTVDRNLLQHRYYQSLQLIFPEEQPLPRELVHQMLSIWSRQSNWRAFWKLWRDLAREGAHRDADLYALFFDCIARNGGQNFARVAVTDWISEMDREVPPVPLDPKIAVGVLLCLREIDFDPSQAHAGKLDVWRSLWNRCWELAHLDPERTSEIPEQTEPRDPRFIAMQDTGAAGDR